MDRLFFVKIFIINYLCFGLILEIKWHIMNIIKSIKLKINMKTFFIFFLFLLSCTGSFAQARLGTAASDIRNEFSHLKMSSGNTDDGDYYLKVTMERSTVIYYFTSKYICYLTMIIPDDQGMLNWYVEHYNNNYVIINSRKWKMYSANGISNIELLFTDEGLCYFMWYLGE